MLRTQIIENRYAKKKSITKSHIYAIKTIRSFNIKKRHLEAFAKDNRRVLFNDIAMINIWITHVIYQCVLRYLPATYVNNCKQGKLTELTRSIVPIRIWYY